MTRTRLPLPADGPRASRARKGLRLALLAVTVAGCGEVTRVDPCAGVTGTCLSLHIDPSERVTRADKFDIAVTGAGFGFRTTSIPMDAPVDLPVAVALVFNDIGASFISVDIDVTGHLNGTPVGAGHKAVALINGEHGTLHIQLDRDPPADAGPGDGDMTPADAGDDGGGDLGGGDLADTDAPLPDLLVRDLTGVLPDLVVVPDLVVRDLVGVIPDLVVVPDLAPPPDLTVMPAITSLTPTSGPNTGNGVRVNINGSNFNVKTVTFGGKLANIVSATATLIAVELPAVAPTVGVQPVVVTNMNNTTANSTFTYYRGVSFAAPVAVASGGMSALSVAAASFNGDGNVDLAVATNSTTLSVLLGTGGGAFAAPVTYAAQGGTSSVVALDLNADARIDLAATNTATDSVSILLGTGTGTFGAPTNVTVGNAPTFITAGLVTTGDTRPDLVVANGANARTSVLVQQVGGNFTTSTLTGLPATPGGVALADHDGDGRLDLFIGNATGAGVYAYDGNGNGGFPTNALLPIGSQVTAVAVANLRGTGHRDVVTTNASGPGVSVLEQKQNMMGWAMNDVLYPTGTNPRALAVADVNNDGGLDIIVANAGSANASVLLNLDDGSGTFRATLHFTTGGTPAHVIAVDVNADNKRDLVVADSAAGNLYILLNNTP